MRLIDHSFADPSWNLACDEFLLNAAEAGEAGETLRFWESAVQFVVLGVAQVLADEIKIDACGRDAVPIHRRCSAGGCVLQGPGCLNYSLVLDQVLRPEIRTIRESYAHILPRVASALSLGGRGTHCAGVSDIAMGAFKFSGNAQRRRKRFILHHGTILYAAELERIDRYLAEPRERPDYRGNRSHLEFVRNIEMNPDEIRVRIQRAFGIETATTAVTIEEERTIGKLAVSKYSDPAWIHRR